MKNVLATLLALAATTSAAPLTARAGPSVTIKNGTVVGSTKDSVDSFIGIPYVQPPVGDLRLRPPQTITKGFGTLNAVGVAPACPQMNMSHIDATGIPTEYQGIVNALDSNFTDPFSEDCLTLNVQRPAGTTASSKLPVMLWIYGGGWEIGNTQFYDGTPILNLSSSLKTPVIFVQFNYRVNAFGFLGGKELQAEHSTNLGLRDQRKAIQWVAENIAAFGGDPDRVTLWGQSAGAISIVDHMTMNGGDNTYNGKPLFHGAILSSGATVPTQAVNSTKAQDVFNTVAKAAGCTPGNNGTATLACLRKVPFQTFLKAMNAPPNYSGPDSNNLAYIRRADFADNFYNYYTDEVIPKGQFTKIPVLAGSLQDEATVFTLSQRNIIKDTSSLVDYFQTWWTQAPRSVVSAYVDTYSEDPAAGLPADTGSQYEVYPEMKRNAAIQTDETFLMQRRILLSYLYGKVNVWSYLGTYQYMAPYWGTFHVSDLATDFTMAVNQYAAKQFDTAYINFVNYLDPNGKASNGTWPKWDPTNLQLLNISSASVSITKDNFRTSSYNYLRSNWASFRQ